MEKFKIEYYVPRYVWVIAEDAEDAIGRVMVELPEDAEDVKVIRDVNDEESV